MLSDASVQLSSGVVKPVVELPHKLDTHYPGSRAVFTAREHDPCTRGPVHTGSVYRPISYENCVQCFDAASGQ